MSNIKTLFIDSSTRPNLSETSTNFHVVINPPIRNISKIQLESFYIPLTWYNVCSTYNNNTININTAGTNAILTLTSGLYNITNLVSTVNTIIQTQRSTLTCTQNSINGLITIKDTSSTPSDFSIVWTPLLGMLGFSSNATLSSAYSYTGTNIPSLIYNSYFLLQIGYCNSPIQFLNNSQNNVSFIIPYGDLYNYSIGQVLELTNTSSDNWTNNINKIDINNIKISLMDQFKNYINLNGSDYYFKLKLYCD